ncbi:MAG: hypothetical protein ACYS8Z_03935 [Planctomycetota bacterium]
MNNKMVKLAVAAVVVIAATIAVSMMTNQQATMAKSSALSDGAWSDGIPARVSERIASMVEAFEQGDAKAWAANFNLQSVFDLARGKIEEPASHPWFSQMTPGDVQNLKNGLARFSSIEQVKEAFVGSVNMDGKAEVLVESAKLNEAGNVVEAVCIVKRSRGTTKIFPKWTNFEGDWWQTDD